MAIKVMTPEQLFDSLTAVTGGLGDGGKGAGKTPTMRGNVSARDRFVAFFMGSENPKATDYEAGIPQALRLMNSKAINSPRTLAEVKGGPESTITALYLATVSRKPTADERKRLVDFVAKSGDPKSAYSDILWALLNSSEFTLNH
jgi:hypothetical protein